MKLRRVNCEVQTCDQRPLFTKPSSQRRCLIVTALTDHSCPPVDENSGRRSLHCAQIASARASRLERASSLDGHCNAYSDSNPTLESNRVADIRTPAGLSRLGCQRSKCSWRGRGRSGKNSLLRFNFFPKKDAQSVKSPNKDLVAAHCHMRPSILVADRSLIEKLERFGICPE